VGVFLRYKSAELKVACAVIGLKQDKHDTMVDEILEFCLKPEDSGRKPKASPSTPKKRSKNSSPSTSKSKASSAKTKRKKRASSEPEDEESDEEAPPKKRSRTREGPARKSSTGKKYMVC